MIPQVKHFENISFHCLMKGTQRTYFPYNMCLRNMMFKHRTTKQFQSNLSFTGFDFVSYKKSKKSRGGGVLTFIKKNISYKLRKGPSISDKRKEILNLGIASKNSCNILLSCCYKRPKGDNDILCIF